MTKIAGKLLTMLLGFLTPEIAREALDAAFDVIENRVADSTNKIDDLLVLPLIAKARELLQVPDGDD